MKKIYIFLLAVLSLTQLNAQDFCSDADSNLIYAYSNVKSAYEANNIDHLKYYSEKSIESFEKAKVNLKSCGSKKAYTLAAHCAELIAKVESQETFEDGRFFVKRARDSVQKSITALNEFTASNAQDEFVGDDTDIIASASDSNTDDASAELSALQIEQERLEQQRLELEAKKKEIAKKLAKQKEIATALEKEKLINKYEEALSENIETYNQLLETYGSTSKVKPNTSGKKDLMNKSVIEIKAFYIDNIKQVTNAYLEELNDI